MLTSFFGAHSFGGDAVYVDRLSRALLRRGHEVTVVYSEDAFQALRGSTPEARYIKPEGLCLKPLRVAAQPFPLLLSHQLGRPVGMQRALREALGEERFDVLHFHNISMLGGPGILSLPVSGNPLRVMTAHEFWLVCERSVLWKNGRETCRSPECIGCSLLAARPPQWWRKYGSWQKEIDRLDLILTPSESSARIHAERGFRRPMRVLPYFLGPEWFLPAPLASTPKPYFLFAGRLVREKGIESALMAIRQFPECELRIAGSGPEESSLKKRADSEDNVRFLGRLNESELLEAYKGALALLVPSEMVETFGYVALEALSAGTPVIGRELGALPEVLAHGGGMLFRNQDELVGCMRRILERPELRRELGERGREAAQRTWCEEQHLESYFQLLESVS